MIYDTHKEKVIKLRPQSHITLYMYQKWISLNKVYVPLFISFSSLLYFQSWASHQAACILLCSICQCILFTFIWDGGSIVDLEQYIILYFSFIKEMRLLYQWLCMPLVFCWKCGGFPSTLDDHFRLARMHLNCYVVLVSDYNKLDLFAH